MSNELTVGKEAYVALVTKDITEAIKPLTKEVFLLDSYIAGTTYLKDESILDELKKGDKLLLRREENRFDPNAILVLDEKNRKLGYVPEKDNAVFARLMDAGKMLTAKIYRMEKKSMFRQINIKIYLVDF